MCTDHNERRAAARILGRASWDRTADRTARTAPGRAAVRANLAKRVDPHGLLDSEERERAVDEALRARMRDLARRSAVIRRSRRHDDRIENGTDCGPLRGEHIEEPE